MLTRILAVKLRGGTEMLSTLLAVLLMVAAFLVFGSLGTMFGDKL